MFGKVRVISVRVFITIIRYSHLNFYHSQCHLPVEFAHSSDVVLIEGNCVDGNLLVALCHICYCI
jgi:hypothetical protein